MTYKRSQLLLARALATISLSAFFLGCAATDAEPEASDDFPTFEEFRLGVVQDSEGRFVVDGDIAIYSEQGLRDFYEEARIQHEDALAAQEGIGVARNPLLVYSGNGIDILQPQGDRFDITYCVSIAFGSRYNTVVSELDAAIRSWSDIIGVRYRFVDEPNCGDISLVDFNVSPAPLDATYFAASFFPGYIRSDRQLLIADSAFTTTSGGRDLQGILRHEIGHTLGFKHEHIVLNPQCTTEAAQYYRAVTEYDVNSVMHYPQCRPSGDGGYRQTYLDYRGANLLYGLAPSLSQAAVF